MLIGDNGMKKDNLYSKTKVELIQIVREQQACIAAHERFNLKEHEDEKQT